MIGVVLAGGKSSRIHPLNLHNSKFMLDILNHPIIYYHIKLLKLDDYCDKIYVICDRFSEDFKLYFDNTDDFNCEVIIDDRHQDCDTGGSIYYAFEDNNIDKAIVTYANTLTTYDISEIINSPKTLITYTSNSKLDNYKIKYNDGKIYLVSRDIDTNKVLCNIMILYKDFVKNSPALESFSLEEKTILINTKLDVDYELKLIYPEFYKLLNTNDDINDLSVILRRKFNY